MSLANFKHLCGVRSTTCQGRPAQTWPCLCSENHPSGALTLDIALGGGFPKGRIIEVPSSIPASLEFADALASAVQASTPKLCSDRSSLSNVNSEHASNSSLWPLALPKHCTRCDHLQRQRLSCCRCMVLRAVGRRRWRCTPWRRCRRAEAQQRSLMLSMPLTQSTRR